MEEVWQSDGCGDALCRRALVNRVCGWASFLRWCTKKCVVENDMESDADAAVTMNNNPASEVKAKCTMAMMTKMSQ